MSIRPVLYLPDPVLRKKARKVTRFNNQLETLITDMIDTMRMSNGVGLAANQVGIEQKVCVIEVPIEIEESSSETEDATPTDLYVLVNPQIVTKKGLREVEEGCLSIPGYRGKVNRSVEVRVRAQDSAGKEFKIKAVDNLLAQALEHEIDQLNGILYIDHLVSHESLWKINDPNHADTEHLSLFEYRA